MLYQYMYPDQNVSSIHLSELCSGLSERGWSVTAVPSNRNIDDAQLAYKGKERWRNVDFLRLWRPRLDRTSSIGRVLGAVWMIARWSLLALRPEPPEVIVIGTDPILSVVVAKVWRLLRPSTKIAHWCFDLYPEAAYAEGMILQRGLIARLLERLVKSGYAACDLIADIGPCMRDRLLRYGREWTPATLVPWALSEPPAPLATPALERSEIFGDAHLALMYSGSFGRAHSHQDILELAGMLQGESLHLAFSVKGQRAAALQAAAAGHTNVSFLPFAAKDGLERRLAAADVHVVSLREEWTGMVIPSKFFGALAVGRPVLFCGSRDSSLARWIKDFKIGWVLEPGGASDVSKQLQEVLRDPDSLNSMRERCYEVYHLHFSRQRTLDGWDEQLRSVVGPAGKT